MNSYKEHQNDNRVLELAFTVPTRGYYYILLLRSGICKLGYFSSHLPSIGCVPSVFFLPLATSTHSRRQWDSEFYHAIIKPFFFFFFLQHLTQLMSWWKSKYLSSWLHCAFTHQMATLWLWMPWTITRQVLSCSRRYSALLWPMQAGPCTSEKDWEWMSFCIILVREAGIHEVKSGGILAWSPEDHRDAQQLLSRQMTSNTKLFFSMKKALPD